MWMMNNSRYQSMQFRNTISALKIKCYDDRYDPNQLKNFIEFNTVLDRIRDTSLERANPELYNAIKQYA
jgi:hypothetical protein